MRICPMTGNECQSTNCTGTRCVLDVSPPSATRRDWEDCRRCGAAILTTHPEADPEVVAGQLAAAYVAERDALLEWKERALTAEAALKARPEGEAQSEPVADSTAAALELAANLIELRTRWAALVKDLSLGDQLDGDFETLDDSIDALETLAMRADLFLRRLQAAAPAEAASETKAVPLEPTEAMLEASTWPVPPDNAERERNRKIYQSMLYAAPVSPSPEERRIPQWIPLSESKPERNDTCLYWDLGGYCAIADEWRDDQHGRTATHWMPLPHPPMNNGEKT